MAPTDDQNPSSSFQGMPEAEPIGLCMNCGNTYPVETTQCPQCRLTLSTVRKCPECQRIQAAQHRECIYCSTALEVEAKQVPSQEVRAVELSISPGLLVTLTLIFVLGAISTYFVLDYVRTGKEPKPAIEQSHVRKADSPRQEPQAGEASQPVEQFQRSVESPEQKAPGSEPLGLSVVGGTLSSSSGVSSSRKASVSRVTVVDQTILPVRLAEAVRLTAGAVIEAEIAQDIRVHQQLAIPRGSLCYLRIEEEGATTPARTPPSMILHLKALVVDDRIYSVSANGMRIVPVSPSKNADFRLEAGTLISFRLNSPLVITGS